MRPPAPAHPLAERDRLAAYLVAAWTDLDSELHRCGAAAVDEPWARTARMLLLQAEAALARFDVHAGWDAALAGQRAILMNPQALDRVQRAALALRREAAVKIDGWRGKAIADLLYDANGELITVSDGDRDAMRVIDAIAVRDDNSQNTWYKIMLRRRATCAASLRSSASPSLSRWCSLGGPGSASTWATCIRSSP